MKINNLFKSPFFLSTLLIIILLNITNQKESTRLKILIWNTPSLTLGTYLSISIGSGFIFSYIISNSLVKIERSKSKNVINYKSENQGEEYNESIESSTKNEYNNTLIERDVKDPIPTVKASFRVIGKTNRSNESIYNIDKQAYDNLDYSEESDYLNYENQINNDNNETNPNINDWNDSSYSNW